MENIQSDNVCNINCLPNEILAIILDYNDCLDVVRFGATCKRFNDLVSNDQSLWKAKFKKTLPRHVTIMVEEKCDGNWLEEIKRYFNVKKDVCAELIQMSPRYYWRTSDVTLEDVKCIFNIAHSHSLSYYYTIITLQDIINHSKRILDHRTSQKPFTLTEMHYAKVTLRHLIHTFLCIKWVKLHSQGILEPDIVVNFFVQWTDTDNLYFDETVYIKIQELINKVADVLNQRFPSKTGTARQRCRSGDIKPRHVLEAVSQILYHQRRMAITPTANVENLDLLKVIHYKCGNQIAVAAIYYVVARHFGVNCELISFPNHFFLEWRESVGNVYTIDLKTGEIRPKRRCPFSHPISSGEYVYNPDSLLQYTYSLFHMTMGALKNWHTHNALLLLDFLGTDDHEYNPYRNFLTYLMDSQLPEMTHDLNIRYLHPDYLELIKTLANMNPAFNTVCRSVNVKKHSSHVKYGVGMICYHKRYDYVCIVRGWDYSCAVEWQRRMEVYNLEYGPKQPFYHVIAADQSERYVAQENLADVAKPSRLYHLEDLIAREFTHFDGFAYVLNDEKRSEYPEEKHVVNMYRTFYANRLRRAISASNSDSDQPNTSTN